MFRGLEPKALWDTIGFRLNSFCFSDHDRGDGSQPAILLSRTEVDGFHLKVMHSADVTHRAAAGAQQKRVRDRRFAEQLDAGQQWTIAIEIPRSGPYEFVARYTKSWDYARIQAFLDGKSLGPEVDTYAATVVPGNPLTLGKLDLAAGRHVLRFQAVGHHPEPKGYRMGIDHVIVK